MIFLTVYSYPIEIPQLYPHSVKFTLEVLTIHMNRTSMKQVDSYRDLHVTYREWTLVIFLVFSELAFNLSNNFFKKETRHHCHNLKVIIRKITYNYKFEGCVYVLFANKETMRRISINNILFLTILMLHAYSSRKKWVIKNFYLFIKRTITCNATISIIS